MIEKDKVVQISFGPDNCLYALTESGSIYKKAMSTGSQWSKIKTPNWKKQNG